MCMRKGLWYRKYTFGGVSRRTRQSLLYAEFIKMLVEIKYDIISAKLFKYERHRCRLFSRSVKVDGEKTQKRGGQKALLLYLHTLQSLNVSQTCNKHPCHSAVY